MSENPAELRYTESHEWVRREDDGSVTIGITDHAQGLLGDLVFVELPEVGSELTSGEAACVVESVKADDRVAAILVDCGAEATNHILNRGGLRPVAIIDHHANGAVSPNIPYQDIRPDVAASATIAAVEPQS